jgi:hypothetical protein
MASSPDYEVVTTDYPAALQNPVIFDRNGGFLQVASLVPRGRDPGGDVGKITVLPITTFSAPSGSGARWGALQMTFNSNRMITIRIIRLTPPPP